MAGKNGASRYKVARLIEKYELVDIGEEIERYWTRSENRKGLRQLADYFNRGLLRAALVQNGSEPLEGEVENIYQLLVDEETSSGVRAQTRNNLERQGINVDEIEKDFVSYQSIYTYLTEYRSADPPDETPSERDQREKRLTTIQRLKTRLTTVTERSLTELVNAGHLTLGDFTVLVTVRVQCTDCDARFPVADLLSGGGCDCTLNDQD